MAAGDERIAQIQEQLKSYPNFPKKGILFWDIFSILNKPDYYRLLRDILVEEAKKISPPIECVAGLEARGFLFGPLISLELNVPFVPIRKKGKLPGNLLSVCYSKEYGPDVLEIQEGSIEHGKRVLIIDDLLATGGTMVAGCHLIKKAGANVAACLVVIELEGLKGRDAVPDNVISLIKL
ncbi:unnamed protein product [Acanthoscelides obtectus]|uniref:Adenine phosphoribosyltransferase n=1 Tax=Acanthoscelides obtectus TaxID=200917 RepID=A0A9P0L516_ACAOB|nr:unnamed protein product [Acanthoscelides obtectus]CAK1656807.1 Adenine phosphoribosyltransferase [Acanthoscelides obtectus]